MSGRLERMPLMDIFQTMAVSKMEGTLHLSHHGEHRSVYFRDGKAWDLVFGRAKAHRLGQRLVHHGLVSRAQLDAALEQQRLTGQPLGQLLVACGLVTEEKIESTARYQAGEELYALFTWQAGEFEFYSGPITDPQVQARVEVIPNFDINATLLEAARRSDEWDHVLEVLGSLDEICVPCAGVDPTQFDGDAAEVFDALQVATAEGEAGEFRTLPTIRDVSGITKLGVFHCARALRDFHLAGHIRLAEPDELLMVAESHLAHDHHRVANRILRTLVDRDADLPTETIMRLAELLQRCGDVRLASVCLWRYAQRSPDADRALELARGAFRLDRRSPPVIEFLRDLLVQQGVAGSELLDVTNALVDALIEDGSERAALATLDDLEEIATDRGSIHSRRAHALEKLDRVGEAVDELIELAELLRQQHRDQALRKTYARILRLDPSRRDIAKQLGQLTANKLVQKGIRMAMVALVACVAAGGWLGWQYYSTEQQVGERVHAIRAALNRGDDAAVAKSLQLATDEFGERPEFDALNRSLAESRQRQRVLEAHRANESVQAELDSAAERFAANDIAGALDTYQALLPQHPDRATGALRSRLSGLPSELAAAVIQLTDGLPPPPRRGQPPNSYAAAMDELDENFVALPLQRAQSLLAAVDHPLLVEMLGEHALTELGTSAQRIEELYGLAEQRKRQYRKLLEHAEASQRLQTVFLAARQAETEHDVIQAARLYEQLVNEYPTDDELRTHFKAKQARYGSITRAMDDIATATARGDYAAALAGLERLCAREPEIPFESIVALPARVTTIPANAGIWLNGEAQGSSPLTVSYIPGHRNNITIRMEGYREQRVPITAEAKGEIDVLLARTPDWAARAGGSIQSQPVCAGGRAYVTDRSGNVLAIEMASGKQLWRHSTGDLSGLLPPPALHHDLVLVASFDGRLRALDKNSGKERWHVDDLPCESTPVVNGGTAVVATVDGTAVGLDPETGEERYRLELPGEVHAGLLGQQQYVYAATSSGWLVCWLGRRGVEVWRQRVAPNLAASPCASGDLLVTVSYEGQLTAVDAKSGEIRWRRAGLPELELAATASGEYVYVAAGESLLRFALADGSPRGVFKGKHRLTAAPQIAGGKVVIGNRAGQLLFIDTQTLEVMSSIRGPAPIAAAFGWDPSGPCLVAFEDGLLQGFGAPP